MAVQIQSDRHFSVDLAGLGQGGIAQQSHGRRASILGGAAGSLREGSAYTGVIGHFALKGHAGRNGQSAVRASGVGQIYRSLVAALAVAVDAVAVDVLAMLTLHDPDITEDLELVIVPVVFRAFYRLESVAGVQQAAKGDSTAVSDNTPVGAACQGGFGSRNQSKVITDMGVAAFLNGQDAAAIQHDCVQRTAEVGIDVQHSPASGRQHAAAIYDGAALAAVKGQSLATYGSVALQGELVAIQIHVDVLTPRFLTAVDGIGQQDHAGGIVRTHRRIIQCMPDCFIEFSLQKVAAGS